MNRGRSARTLLAPTNPSEQPVRLLASLALLLVAPSLGIAQRAGIGQSAGPANDQRPEALQGIRFDQHLNAQVPPGLTFTDDRGREVKLGDYFGEQPVILVLAYYRCPMLCNLVLNRLVQGMLQTRFDPGQDFQVVTVSFAAEETWRQAAAKKRTYVRRYGEPGAAKGWHFLTGRRDQIDQLTDAVGFHYEYDAERDLYIHPAGIMVLTPQGKISRYIFDVKYSGRDLRLALVEASESKIASPVDQILLYCFHYDPDVGRYTASIMNLVRAGGVAMMIFLVLAVWFLSRSRRLKAAVVNRVQQLGGEQPAERLGGET